MDRDGKYWTERGILNSDGKYGTVRGNIGQRGKIFDRDGKYLIETENIGNEILIEEDGEV